MRTVATRSTAEATAPGEGGCVRECGESFHSGLIVGIGCHGLAALRVRPRTGTRKQRTSPSSSAVTCLQRARDAPTGQAAVYVSGVTSGGAKVIQVTVCLEQPAIRAAAAHNPFTALGL